MKGVGEKGKDPKGKDEDSKGNACCATSPNQRAKPRAMLVIMMAMMMIITKPTPAPEVGAQARSKEHISRELRKDPELGNFPDSEKCPCEHDVQKWEKYHGPGAGSQKGKGDKGRGKGDGQPRGRGRGRNGRKGRQAGLDEWVAPRGMGAAPLHVCGSLKEDGPHSMRAWASSPPACGWSAYPGDGRRETKSAAPQEQEERDEGQSTSCPKNGLGPLKNFKDLPRDFFTVYSRGADIETQFITECVIGGKTYPLTWDSCSAINTIPDEVLLDILNSQAAQGVRTDSKDRSVVELGRREEEEHLRGVASGKLVPVPGLAALNIMFPELGKNAGPTILSRHRVCRKKDNGLGIHRNGRT